MINNTKILAIITARAGSKRLPNKNIKNLAGKPLIAWSIEAALSSKYIDKTIVSTDSNEIKKISESYGASVPFIRPTELASDTSDSISVLKHAIDFFQNEYKYIVLLQPTSPLRSVDDINAAIEMLNNDTKSVISVCETDHSPLWANVLPEDFSMENFIRPEIRNKRSQDLPKYYRLNGAVYVSEIKYLYENNGFLGHQTKAYVMPRERSIDIDNEIDFKLAELVLKSE
ncbi:MAG: CMP-N-acetlyneuraminic acid synthetase [Bacteroidetes bacterium GWF2_33_38]|nr:MAG: CMP-N-acetlyneuraminic acid synthetase [Bacteroidetes bacterium GWF2_33_38]OFY72782.1 MAG: CMP-N-acetlyneuraminic acid synthetase [Bacteroidetes bacterium RIFOXYA12_FULL_33_9]OFY91557.1 MAG: CMP-N-acetlyneuraminic acid synthetase [Bacteroidetes bacterium RIFOXYA2_FULL_33_7]HBX50595.1 CMP-N-acetlyneuraminic acid synthetase [Bacteroidales bacterium]